MAVTIERFEAGQLQSHLAEFVALLCNIVDNGASVNFLAPLPKEESERYWRNVALDLPRGNRILLAAVDERRVVGSIQLALATQPNGPHRAEVQKVFVNTSHRNQGIARRLMSAIEQVAREHQRTLLVLDTERGSAAETLYEKMGYQRVGIVPGFALNTSGEPTDAVFFYRILS